MCSLRLRHMTREPGRSPPRLVISPCLEQRAHCRLMIGNLGAEVAARCHAEPEVLCSSAATSPLLHVAYKPFTGRLHSPGENLLYGGELQAGGWQGARLKLTGGQDERSAGWDRHPRAAGTPA